MNAIDCIKTRRSIRKFQDKPVDQATIEQIIEAAASLKLDTIYIMKGE